MKKLLLGLLIIGSFSSAATCTYYRMNHMSLHSGGQYTRDTCFEARNACVAHIGTNEYVECREQNHWDGEAECSYEAWLHNHQGTGDRLMKIIKAKAYGSYLSDAETFACKYALSTCKGYVLSNGSCRLVR